MEKKDLQNLKEACKTLGLEYSEFIDMPEELEKGVSIDYKSLYESQKLANQQILIAFGNMSSSFDSKFNEIQKGINGIEEKFSIMKDSPMHQRKSISSVSAIEKGFNNEKKADLTFDLKNTSDLRALKKYLGDKMSIELEKGISDGFYQKAALMLDANKNLTRDLISELFNKDKILVKQ